MASPAVERMFAKLKSMNLQLGGITIAPGTRDVDSDQVANNIYESLCDLERQWTGETTTNADSKLDEFRTKYAGLEEKFSKKST